MRDFVIKQSGALKYLTIPFFTEERVIHGFSTRRAANPEGSSNALDTGVGDGKREFKGVKNRRLFINALNLEGDFWALKQVHGRRVFSVGEKVYSRGEEQLEGDGLVTDQRGVILTMYSADCVIIFLFDPVQRAAALGHAGWRGTLKGIGPELVRSMASSYGCRPENIMAGISPSIGLCCYEVGEEVIEKLNQAVKEPELFIKHGNSGKYMLDLKLLNAELLRDAGIQEKKITVSSHCTFCNPDLFFSYRRDGGFSGRMMSVICLP